MRLPALGRVQLVPVPNHFRWEEAPQRHKWTLKTRTKAEALRHAAKLEHDLEALLDGKPVRQKALTVEAAVQEWLTFRSKNGLTNTKPKFMGDKLVEWCKKNDVLPFVRNNRERRDFQQRYCV